MGEFCVGNPFSQPVTDGQCASCAGGKYWWPCNFETLCFCNSMDDGAPRVPPAPKSYVKANEEVGDPCERILTEEVFNAIVQPKSEEGRALYTYLGLCNAIAQYNAFHDEKFAGMGDETQIRAELAGFLAHTAVDTRGFSVVREEFHCVDPITGSDGQVYCKPCREEHYDAGTKSCRQSYLVSEESYGEYCDASRQPPQGCGCDKDAVTQVNVPVPAGLGNVDTSGYIAASDAYFTRGAIQISWNYDYYGTSLSMTGKGDFLCDNPDLVATSPQYAWGAGLFKWMEKMTFGTQGTTAHKQILKGNFGGTVKALYGELECPPNQWTSAIHVDMAQERVGQICKAGSALGVHLEMNKCDTPSDCLECDGFKEIHESCLANGSCPECATWTEFLISTSPTVTPIRVTSPSWDDWSSNYGVRSSRAAVTRTGCAMPMMVVLTVMFPFFFGVI